MDKTQAVVSHQPPLLVCSSIHPKAFPHDSCHGVPGGSSCKELALESTTSFAHRRLSLVSVIQKSAFFSLPPSSLFGHGTSLCEGTEQGSPGDKRATEAGAELVGSELAMDHRLPRVCPVGPPGSPLPSWSTCEAGPLSETPCLVELHFHSPRHCRLCGPRNRTNPVPLEPPGLSSGDQGMCGARDSLTVQGQPIKSMLPPDTPVSP